MPAGFDGQTGGPAHGLAEADDGKKESQSTAQPQGLMIKSRPTEYPQHSLIQASRRAWTEEQIEKSGLVKPTLSTLSGRNLIKTADLLSKQA
jgi:hypothetical protein